MSLCFFFLFSVDSMPEKQQLKINLFSDLNHRNVFIFFKNVFLRIHTIKNQTTLINMVSNSNVGPMSFSMLVLEMPASF